MSPAPAMLKAHSLVLEKIIPSTAAPIGFNAPKTAVLSEVVYFLSHRLHGESEAAAYDDEKQHGSPMIPAKQAVTETLSAEKLPCRRFP